MRKILFLLLTLTIVGCVKKNQYKTISGFAQGTTYNITYQDNGVGEIQTQVDSLLKKFDYCLSNYNDSSTLSRVNRGEDIFVDHWFATCFDLSKDVYNASDHLFDPSLRPLINAYGFGAKGQKEFRVLDSAQLVRILQKVGFDKVRIAKNKVEMPDSMSLDFSAIAQGYSVDILAQYFDDLKIDNYIVEVGGEIYAKGVNQNGAIWRVGIDTPTEGNFISGASIEQVIELNCKGLATSGNYRKYFELEGKKYSHQINPKTGLCARDSLLSATIVAQNAALADGYATACMVGGYEWSKKFLKTTDMIAYLIFENYKGEMVTEKIIK